MNVEKTKPMDKWLCITDKDNDKKILNLDSIDIINRSQDREKPIYYYIHFKLFHHDEIWIRYKNQKKRSQIFINLCKYLGNTGETLLHVEADAWGED